MTNEATDPRNANLTELNMSLLADLTHSPSSLTTSSKFTAINGAIYLAAGGMLLIWPGAVQAIFLDHEFVGREGPLVRVLGMTVVIIGWFYLFGGRAGCKPFVAASVLDRIVLVPLVLIPIAMAGVFPHLLLTFAVLDPLLGLIAWYLLSRERKASLAN